MKRRSFASPIGRLTVDVQDEAVLSVWFDGESANDDSPLLREVEQQLREYFAGHRQAFALPLAPRGTEFQRAVWRELRRIPFGATVSYGEVAKRLGASARAVGGAVGRNPIGIVIPCHRVIGANGKLVGFGGGLPTKEFLLRLEGTQAELPITYDRAKPLSLPID